MTGLTGQKKEIHSKEGKGYEMSNKLEKAGKAFIEAIPRIQAYYDREKKRQGEAKR